MRSLYRSSIILALASAATFLPQHGLAGSRGHGGGRYEQKSFTLPGVSMPGGFDEVRAADGTTCRAAMGGSGAYLDSGVIGGGLNEDTRSLSAYGRLVVPLGRQPTRLNCDRLYQLELRRLELEVKMLERGLDPRGGGVASSSGGWAEGPEWTHKGE